MIEEEMRSRRVRNESEINNRTRKDLDNTLMILIIKIPIDH